MEELRTRLAATERRFQEANELLQAQIAERKRSEEPFEKAQKYTEGIVETIRKPLTTQYRFQLLPTPFCNRAHHSGLLHRTTACRRKDGRLSLGYLIPKV